LRGANKNSIDRHIKEHTHDLYAQLRTFLWTQWRHENGFRCALRPFQIRRKRADVKVMAPSSWESHRKLAWAVIKTEQVEHAGKTIYAGKNLYAAAIRQAPAEIRQSPVEIRQASTE
jgi:hypothetical protein